MFADSVVGSVSKMGFADGLSQLSFADGAKVGSGLVAEVEARLAQLNQPVGYEEFNQQPQRRLPGF